MIIGEVAAIISLAKSALDLTTAVAKGAKNKSEKEQAEKLRATLADLQEKLIGVQSHCYELEEEKRNLRSQLEAKVKWETEADRWELTELADGLYAYKVKSPSAAEVNLRACPHCFQKHKVSVFQRPSQNNHRRVCPECGFEFIAVHLESRVAFGSHHGMSF